MVTLIGNRELSQGDTPESLEKYIEWQEQPSWDKDCSDSYRLPGDCSPEIFERYIRDLEAIIEEILSLRSGSPTIIRAMDYYMPLYSEWKEWGIQEECTCCCGL